MKAKFSWQTEEASVEDEVASATQDRRPNKRFLRIVAISTLLVCLTAYWQIQRIHAREEVVRDDIRASYLVWYRAVQNGDRELFLNQISTQETAWRNAQEQLFDKGQLLSWPDLGLKQASPEEAAPQIESIELSPDWQEAEMTVRYGYQAAHEPGQPIRYFRRLHTLRYQPAAERWLFAPPPPDFWGAQVNTGSALLSLTYPQRDEQLLSRLGQAWQQEIDRLCQEAGKSGESCLGSSGISLDFTTDTRQLPSDQSFSPLFLQPRYLLPTPSLVGLPADDAAFSALQEAYAGELLGAVRQHLFPPVALPDGALQLLCFPEGESTIQLFRYEPADGNDSWQHELPGRPFRFLMPFPGGDGIVLQPLLTGPNLTRLQLWRWQNGTESLLFDGQMRDQISRPAGWGISNMPRLLLQSISGLQQNAQYWLDLERCDSSGCRLTELPGFTTWSPDGRHTLIARGPELLLGDGEGKPLELLDDGHSPFWIDNDHYGYARYDRQQGAPFMEVVVASVGVAEPQVVLTMGDITRMLDLDESAILFINHIVANHSDPDLLLLSATILGVDEGKYHIFSFRISTGEARLLLQLEQPPTGYSAQLTPAGYSPFRLSPDGRWLMVTYLVNRNPTEWAFELFDLREEEDQQLAVSYPHYPARFPFYDWTPDGRWLVIVEDGYLRLVAPGSQYERLTPYHFDACYYAAWVVN